MLEKKITCNSIILVTITAINLRVGVLPAPFVKFLLWHMQQQIVRLEDKNAIPIVQGI